MYFGFENYNNKGVQNAFILSRMGDPDLHGDHDAYRLKRTGDLDLQFLIRRSRCLIQLKTNWKSWFTISILAIKMPHLKMNWRSWFTWHSSIWRSRCLRRLKTNWQSWFMIFILAIKMLPPFNNELAISIYNFRYGDQDASDVLKRTDNLDLRFPYWRSRCFCRLITNWRSWFTISIWRPRYLRRLLTNWLSEFGDLYPTNGDIFGE